MEVYLPAKLLSKLERVAEEHGRDAQSLVREAVERLVSFDEWFVREAERG